MNDTCATCKFVSAETKTCRENSPKVFILGLNEEMKPMIVTAYPQTQLNSWCGKHVVKLNILAGSR